MRAVRLGDRRIVEPRDLANRTEERRDGPLMASGVEQLNAGDLAECVVAREHRVRTMIPAVVTLGRGGRRDGRDVAPPRRFVDADRIELDAVALSAFAATRNVEDHDGLTIERGEHEAAIVEMDMAERVSGANFARREISAGENRIARRFIAATATVGNRTTDVGAEELGDCRRRTSA